MQYKWIFAFLIGVSAGMVGNFDVPFSGETDEPSVNISFGVEEAQAAAVRRVARRTSRRTTRRVVRRQSIAGCSLYRSYYNCGGVYYSPIVENGVTVYIVVNP
ncbi:MAG: hypothetical protein ACR2O3_11515 [Rhizobiaceae bacterium]